MWLDRPSTADGHLSENAQRGHCAVPTAPARTRGAGEQRAGQGVPPGRLPRSLSWVRSPPRLNRTRHGQSPNGLRCAAVSHAYQSIGLKDPASISAIGMETPLSCWTRLWQRESPARSPLPLCRKFPEFCFTAYTTPVVYFAGRKSKIRGRRDRFSSAPARPSLNPTDEDLSA